ncbi:gamma-secretase subunit pen-2-like [Lineus longissimus]|uniref:gamma-secretase subunit pen-2-like n=1 Tax=Lineus longissimus TaxID=88925 RepID=UPI002B4E4CA1
MDLRKMKDDDKLDLCRKYYLGGFALLPFLWFINFVWFFKEAFRRPAFEQQKQIKSYVIQSIIGTSVWIALITAWVVIFQLNRASWGATADYMSFIIPKGVS